MIEIEPSNNSRHLNLSPRLKNNSFDLLRLIFAAIVCFVHMYEISGFTQLAWVHNIFSSKMAIRAFFIISGFLIFMSFENSTSIKSYARKRFLRIYPAYFTVVFLFAIVLVSISSKSFYDYFSIEWVKYLFANLTFWNFLKPTLPGVFETNPMPAINGALWTLKIEVMFYLSVPFFVYLFKKFTRFWIILSTYLLSISYAVIMGEFAQKTGSGLYGELARQLPGQLSYFMAGAFLFYYLSLFERYVRYFLLIATVVLVVNLMLEISMLSPFALAVWVIFIALYLPFKNFGKYGDFSYGIYIVHFPVIQIFIFYGWFSKNAFGFVTAISLLVTILAILLWHLVEKRFLARKLHYVSITA